MEPTINMAEVMKELDRLREEKSDRNVERWKKLDPVIISARTGENKISYAKLSRFIEKHFKIRIAVSTLRDHAVMIMGDENA